MKILVGYLPLKSEKGIATLGQNRQFQYFSNATFIFPLVPASAATLLKKHNYQILWKDSIAEHLDEEQFLEYLKQEQPDLIAVETKTPAIKKNWKTINKIKETFPEIKIVLMGDHPTVLPEESLNYSKADYIITGGNYDFMLLSLANHLKNNEQLPKGIYYKEDDEIKNTGKFELNNNLDELPFIDREITKCFIDYQKEYNIKVRPFAYILSARDCWWGKCKFCVWNHTLYPQCKIRSPENVLDEIGELINKYKVKEIFDDAGTLPTGNWLKTFCKGMIERGYNKKITFSCNMRFGILKQEDYNLMKKANFRLLKFGLESANQETLDKLNKGIKVEDIKQGCEMAKKAGLTVHLTMIIGYPWETKAQALNTYNLAKKLMLSGKADVLQSTILVPYPGTPLWYEAKEKEQFLIDPKDYEAYDMSKIILKTPDMSPEQVKNICNQIYRIFINPKYIYQHLKKIKSFEDIKYTLNGTKAILGHLVDFKE